MAADPELKVKEEPEDARVEEEEDDDDVPALEAVDAVAGADSTFLSPFSRRR